MAKVKKTKKKLSSAQRAALKRGRAKAAKNRKKVSRTPKKKVYKEPLKGAVMATKKRAARKSGGSKKSTSRTRRRSRGGGSSKGSVMRIVRTSLAGVGGGILAGTIANKVPIPNPKFRPLVPILGGVGLAALGMKRGNPMVSGIATGMIILGSIAAVRQYFPQVPLLAGEEDDTLFLPNNIGGDIQELGYYPDFDDGLNGVVELGDEDDLEEIFYQSPATI